MTTINEPPSQPPEKPSPMKRLVNKLKSSPKKTASGIIAIAALGSLGYWGAGVLVKKHLPPFLENQIGKFIQRPIDLGEIEGLSLTGIELGKTVIPTTATDPDRVEVAGIKIGFNLLPVLFRRTLPLDVALTQPDIYLEQEQNGEWLNLDFLEKNEEPKDPLVYVDLDLDIEQGDITAVPYERKPIKALVDGTGRFHQKQELLDYDLDATIEQAKASLQGNTELATGTTDTKVLIEDLALTDIATLVPNAPVKLDSGKLDADLDVNIPSWSQITAAKVEGEVNLHNLAGEVTDLDAPLQAESQLNFTGRSGEVKQAQASLGDITAQVVGQVNLDRGYDLEAQILPFQLSSLPPQVIKQIPVPVSGEVTAEVQLQGAIKEPKLTGKINNTRTIVIDKTPFKQIDGNFRADLAEIVLENVNIIPAAGGNITARGKIQTQITESLERDRTIDLNYMPLAFSFEADLPSQELIAPYYELPPQVAVGNLNAQGEVRGTINDPQAEVKWQIPEANIARGESIAGTGEVVFADNNLSLNNTRVTYGEGQADITGNANLNNQQWQASLDANSLKLTPFIARINNPNLNLNRPIALDTARVNLNGNLDNLAPENIQATADFNLDVDGGELKVTSQLANGNVQAQAIPRNIQLDPFVTNLTVDTELQSGTINASGKLQQLLALGESNNLNSLQGDSQLDLSFDGSPVAVNSKLNRGIVSANANTNQIDLNRVVPNLPLPANLRASQVTATGELQQLLSFGENPNLSTVDARVDADLDLAGGTVKAIANLNDNRWQATANASNISSQLLLDKYAPSNLAAVEFDNIDAEADLTGDILPLIKQESNLPVTVNQIVVNSGVQQINARGDFTLTEITNNPDLGDTNLDVTAKVDFDRLPIKQIVAANTQNNQLIVDSVNVRGQAEFDGQFQGKNLISAPNNPENINLTGNLNLENFGVNEIAFDPQMAGEVKLQPGSEIALNLTGEQDVIAARTVPCTEDDCQLPYLPTNLELRQGEDTNQPLIVTGDSQENKFSLDINNFPLALLNLAPGTSAGIEGALNGITTGNIALDFNTLATKGDIAIAKPGLGYIQGDNLSANFNYDPLNNIAEVKSSSLDLGRSQYNFNAALDLASGAIDGKLNIPQAYIQDVLTTLRWFTVEDITRLFDTPDYGVATTVQPNPAKGTVDKSIARQINRLRQINRQIQASAIAKESLTIPTKIDLQGKYTGEIDLGGTIQTPQAKFKVEGKNWQWQPKEAYIDVVPPLGLVKEESQFINLPKLLVQGELQGNKVDLEQAELQIQEAVLSLQGKLSPEEVAAKFAVAKLTVDNIANFVELPVDLAGEIHTVGTLEGTVEKPKIAGKIAFTEGAFNGNVLPAEIAGNYDYDGSKLAFHTTAPDSIKAEAKVPYPIIPGKSDRLTAKVDLKKEAFVFLDALSQNYLSWVEGEGDAQVEADARLDLERKGVIYDLNARGTVNLQDANVNVETPFFSESFIGTGKITLDDQIINVENLEGVFAEKDLSAKGKFPILKPVDNLDNPLTVNIPEGKINIDKLYKGGIAGNISVTGASLEPVIGGEIDLENGKVSIPKIEKPPTDSVKLSPKQENNPISNNKASNKAPTQPASSVVTALNDLQINLKEFKLEQTPIYKFQLDGNLLLNGTVDVPQNIRPQGKFTLTKANVNLLSTNFKLARNLDNEIIFTPEAGVLNPMINVTLRTEVENGDSKGSDGDNQAQDSGEQEEQAVDNFSSLQSVESNTNEINDPLSNATNIEAIRISLVVDGTAEDILPNLAQNDNNCIIRPVNSPIVENNQYYTEKELNRLTECFNGIAQRGGSDRNLINSSGVELTSIPSLDRGEIISLLSSKSVSFVQKELAGGSGGSTQERLFDFGVNRFVIDPLLDSTLDRVDNTTVKWGEKIGLDYLTVYPDLEGTYEIDRKSSLRFIYDFNLLSDVSNLAGVDLFDDEGIGGNEVRVQYQLNFK